MISKTKLILAAATSMLALGTSAALASGPVIVDDVEIYVPPAPTLSWAGAYGGLSVSDVSGDLQQGVTNFPLGSTTGFGLFAGYNWQHGNVVFGGELSYIDFEADYITSPGSTQNNSTEIRARLGYALDRVMFYGFVGYGRSTLASLLAGSAHLNGAVYGLGVETMFGSNMFGGLEIARRDYSGTLAGFAEELTLDTISLRFGYRF